MLFMEADDVTRTCLQFALLLFVPFLSDFHMKSYQLSNFTVATRCYGNPVSSHGVQPARCVTGLFGGMMFDVVYHLCRLQESSFGRAPGS